MGGAARRNTTFARMRTPDFPHYHQKSKAEIAADRYERWDPTVLRQVILHQCDAMHGGAYPSQPVLDYFGEWLPTTVAGLRVVEVGCGVGRMIAELAIQHPDWHCTGLDYSQALLKQAHRTYTRADEQVIDAARFGWGHPTVPGERVTNVDWGLAKAEALPYEAGSVDVVLSSFLLDRLEDPLTALLEWQRVLPPGGRVIGVTPLNFFRAKLWDQFYPPVKLVQAIIQQGWTLLDWREGITVEEPLDGHGNAVNWRAIGFCLQK